MTLLEVRNLAVSFHTYAGKIQAVRDVSFSLEAGETLVVVGESGCGKSVMSKSLVHLLPKRISEISPEAEILFEGKNIAHYSERQMQKIRGKEIALIFQDPMTYLNPTMKVGNQIAESIIIHEGVSRREAIHKAIELLQLVRIPEPEKRVFQYPHEFSGGMRQRVVIAIALACEPKLLIADEPTTALDVTTQADIMDLLLEIQKVRNTAIMLITHDLGLAAEVADRIQVMYAGQLVEKGSKEDIFRRARHPYTNCLLRSIPTMEDERGDLYSLRGKPPDLLNPPTACAFSDRCDYAMPICRKQLPEFFSVASGHRSRCWLEHEFAPSVPWISRAKK